MRSSPLAYPVMQARRDPPPQGAEAKYSGRRFPSAGRFFFSLAIFRLTNFGATATNQGKGADLLRL